MDTGIVIGPAAGPSRPGLPRLGSRDEVLAHRLAGGDERAFTEIHRRYHGTLYRYCRSIVRHEQDAQDALQATLICAYNALREGRRDAPLRPWLFRIAHNESISLLRRRRPETELSDALPAPAGVEETAHVRERLSRLIADLATLPDRQRSALVMRELNGLSHEDIAAALQTTPAAAKQTIFEARRALADLEAGRTMSCEEICRVLSDGDRRSLRGRRVRAHLRACQDCSAFAEAIRHRSADLRALTPLLPPAAGAMLLSRVLGAAGNGAGGSSTAATAGQVLAGSSVAKAVVAGAVLAGGVAGYAHVVAPAHHPAVHPATIVRAGRELRLVQPRTLGAPGSPAGIGVPVDGARRARTAQPVSGVARGRMAPGRSARATGRGAAGPSDAARPAGSARGSSGAAVGRGASAGASASRGHGAPALTRASSAGHAGSHGSGATVTRSAPTRTAQTRAGHAGAGSGQPRSHPGGSASAGSSTSSSAGRSAGRHGGSSSSLLRADKPLAAAPLAASGVAAPAGSATLSGAPEKNPQSSS